MKRISKRQSTSDEQEVKSLERDAFAAALARSTDYFERVASETYLGIDADGNIRTKAETLETRRSIGAKYDAIEVADQAVRLYGNAALVTGHVHREATNEGPGNYRFTRVYIKHQGQWRLESSQFTRVK
jgi:UDP-2,3-diacylglucosamine pyrophosphatase LpxH